MKRSKRRFRRKVKNFILKTVTFLNFMSLLFWICVIDAIISWQPYAIMAANFAWLVLFGWANGYFDIREEVEHKEKDRQEDVCVIPVDFAHGSSREDNRTSGNNRRIM